METLVVRSHSLNVGELEVDAVLIVIVVVGVECTVFASGFNQVDREVVDAVVAGEVLVVVEGRVVTSGSPNTELD